MFVDSSHVSWSNVSTGWAVLAEAWAFWMLLPCTAHTVLLIICCVIETLTERCCMGLQDLIYCVCEFAAGGDLYTALAADYDHTFGWYNRCHLHQHSAAGLLLHYALPSMRTGRCRCMTQLASMTAHASLQRQCFELVLLGLQGQSGGVGHRKGRTVPPRQWHNPPRP